jgi:hypothetical protein
MAIKDIEEKLYKREAEEVEKKSLEFEALNPKHSDEEPFSVADFSAGPKENKDIWIKAEEEKKEKRKKFLKIAGISLGAALTLAALVWGALLWRSSAFSEDKVKVSISGPESVKSGETVAFEIIVENSNRAALKNAVLVLKYPENFKPFGNLQFEQQGGETSRYAVGTIEKKSAAKVAFQGKFYGPKDFLAYVEAKIEYSSANFSSQFTADGKTSVFISSTPLIVEVSGPQNVATGGGVSYKIVCQNNGGGEFKDLKIKAEYPGGFSFSSSEPLPASGNNVWYVGNLAAGQRSEVNVSGTISGLVDEVKTIKAFVGEFGEGDEFVAYGEAESEAKIVGSAIAITQTINDKKENITVNAGEALQFKIKYKNTGKIGLRDVILTEEIKSPILEYSKLDMKESKGGFDTGTSIITWKASDVPEFSVLDPGEEGEILFSIPVKDVIPVASAKDKNFSFKAVVKMDSPDVPTPEGMNKIIPGNVLDAKLNSKLVTVEEGFYNDAEIANSGSLPLKVGAETTFAMHLKLSNVSNDVTDAKVAVTFAPGTKWKNNFLPQNSDVSFNERANELVWSVGTMPAGMGIITDPKELIFQMGLVPSQNQVGSYAPLTSKVVFSAKDSFTGQILKSELGEKTTDLREDISVGEGGKVSQ